MYDAKLRFRVSLGVETILLTVVVNISKGRLEGNRESMRQKKLGGADGIRTHGLLDAIEARSQLRHGPTVLRC